MCMCENKPELVIIGRSGQVADIAAMFEKRIRKQYHRVENYNTDNVLWQRQCGSPMVSDQQRYISCFGAMGSFRTKLATLDSLEIPRERYVNLSKCKEANLSECVGTIIYKHSYVSPTVKLGDHCLISNHCSVAHDSTLGNGVFMAAGGIISGACRVGNSVFIGASATLKNDVLVCDDVMIGAGAVVTKDITEPGIYIGTPARKLRDHE